MGLDGGNKIRGKYPEFTSSSIKQERRKYFKSIVQPFRGGDLAREFVEAYPDKARGMVGEGIVTKEQVRRSKNVWKDQPGWGSRDKSL